jgi:DNA-binding CsgD family transcriptional regulator
VEPVSWGDKAGDWRAAIEPEEGNIRSALIWAIDQGETDLALGLASARFDQGVSNFHGMTGASAQADRQRGLRALALPGGSPANRVRALITASWLAHAHGDFTGGRDFAVEALDLARTGADRFGIANASFVLGIAAFHEGDIPTARRHLTDARIAFQELHAAGRRAWSLIYLASLDSLGAVDEGGDPEILAHAAALREEALSIFRAVNHPHGVSRTLHGLAYIAYKQRDMPRALALTQEALALDWQQNWPVYYYLEDLADIAGRIGQPETAARMYGAADALRELAGHPVEPVFRDEFERDLAVSRDAIGEEAFAEAWTLGRQQPVEEMVAEALALNMESVDRPRVSLTARQMDVLQLLVTGMPDSAIAEALFLSVRTVEHHVAQILSRLGVQSRASAAAAARDAGLVPPEPRN